MNKYMYKYLKYFWLYFRYKHRFVNHTISKYSDINSQIKIASMLETMNRTEFTIYMIHNYSDAFPLMFNVYWAFKYACGMSIEGGEYCYLNRYLSLISCGINKAPDWFKNEFPHPKMMPGLIPIKEANNERRNDLKYSVTINRNDGTAHQTPPSLAYRCMEADIHNWLIDNCNGEWNFNEFVGEITVKFTDENDAAAFKLVWA